MKGKIAKRIRVAARVAARISGRSIAELKREYRAQPYHKRKIEGVHVDGHSELLRRAHRYGQ